MIGRGTIPILVLAALTVATAASARAGDLYKWQDEQGIWHFSDRPPTSGVEVEVERYEIDPVPAVTMQRVGNLRQPGHVFHNGLHGPVEIEIWLNEAENVSADTPLPATFVLEGQQRERLVTFGVARPGRASRYQLAFNWTPGRPISGIPEATVLPTPFDRDRQFVISQASGTGTHVDPANRHAVDIAMPVGTPVLAVIDGLVMDAEDGFYGGGTDDDRYIHRANRVVLLHDDGRMTVYAHLEAGSVRVRPGQRVRRGEAIGRSGNTGFSSGPHLHFAWQQNVGRALVALPFYFEQPGDRQVVPRAGLRLRGTQEYAY